MNDLVQAWVEGWVVSRGAAPPLTEPWGWTIDVGRTDHVTRHVLGAVGDEVDETVVRKVADAVTGDGVWFKAFADPEVVHAWLGPRWRLDPEPGCLMSLALTPDVPEPAPVPTGYRLRTWSRGGVTQALVTAPDGALAARGQIAPTGATAVVDQVETAPAHRRRGLGGLVVHTLQDAAAARGARTAVLAGTPEGRALYESLGWIYRAPLTSAKFTAAC
ncbi:GNAT family N-acetyltransferase [Streptomyces sp. NPDC050732]|uniref:GNAT family N-acetyltransferase n=1 Tax=Streptomyces sp. NPDC050732 TaxID=3154632 RepID=UPI003429DD16